MDSLVGYGSEEENESERSGDRYFSVGQSGTGGSRRRDDDTNYDDVNMDMSEDSQGAESEPELPPADAPSSRYSSRDDRDRRGSDDSRSEREYERKDRRRDYSPRRDRDRRSPRRDDKYRSERSERNRGYESSARRGLLGDRPDEKGSDSKVPALMDLKPFGGDAPPSYAKSQDARDAASPRFIERDRRERSDRDRGDRNDRGERNDRSDRNDRNDRNDRSDRDRERDRDRDRYSRRSQEKRSGRGHGDRERRSRSRGAAYPPPSSTSTSDRRGSPSGEYRPSSYKVNKKLEVMEKMGLQIKTPDGGMATAQQLRLAAGECAGGGGGGGGGGAGLPSYYNPTAVNASKILQQVHKRKLLWAAKREQDAAGEAAKWTGTRFAQDADGRQATKFMRLMGIKEPGALKPEQADQQVDPIKKQEELFQAMQAQYEVARATTHTMRGVGLGFQRGQY